MDDRLPAKMIIFVLSISLLSLASGQKMIVAHAPQYVTFQEQGKPLPTSDVSKMISHTLGMPTKSDMTWHGMQHGSVFKRPKANVLVTVLTVEGQPGPMVTSKAEFPVELDNAGVDISELMSSLNGNFMGKTPLTVDTGLDNSIFDVRSGFDVFKRIPNTLRRMSDRLMDGDSVAQQHTVGTLNSSINTDLSLMGELQVIQDVINTVKSDESFKSSGTPDIFSFTISGLQGLAQEHGQDSSQVADAGNLISSFLNKMTEQFITLYKDNVVVEILLVTPPTGYVRKVRALQQATTPKPAVPIIRNETNSKVAPDYDENYPVMFNIVLWLMIFLAVSMLAVSYGIWNIDPGRDSIIYRMTTTRLKKD
ncbi:renin receptor-like [Mya arenaria]|uniref:renin receptor-like n=1 Tax=Mya arenaria TaxID=6604 RepID=UPI0022E77970|nr:renin receptor-like [Mya arenaria]